MRPPYRLLLPQGSSSIIPIAPETVLYQRTRREKINPLVRKKVLLGTVLHIQGPTLRTTFIDSHLWVVARTSLGLKHMWMHLQV